MLKVIFVSFLLFSCQLPMQERYGGNPYYNQRSYARNQCGFTDALFGYCNDVQYNQSFYSQNQCGVWDNLIGSCENNYYANNYQNGMYYNQNSYNYW